MFTDQDLSLTRSRDHRAQAIRDAATRATEIVQSLRTTWKTVSSDHHQSPATLQASADERSLSQLISIIAALASEAEHSASVAQRQYESPQQSPELRRLPPEIAQHRILETAEAAAFCGFSVAHWRRLYRTGKAPKPIQLSTRKLGWRAGDLIKWLQARLDSS